MHVYLSNTLVFVGEMCVIRMCLCVSLVLVCNVCKVCVCMCALHVYFYVYMQIYMYVHDIQTYIYPVTYQVSVCTHDVCLVS
jgi:hypothetical protein